MSLAWGLNGAVLQFSGRAGAQGQALGQMHLRLHSIRKAQCSARCYFLVSPLQPECRLLPALTSILSTLDAAGCREQCNSCGQWLLAHLFLKGVFTWGFIYFIYLFICRGFFVCLFSFPIYNLHQTLSGKCNFIREKQTNETITSLAKERNAVTHKPLRITSKTC